MSAHWHEAITLGAESLGRVYCTFATMSSVFKALHSSNFNNIYIYIYIFNFF